jgi:hypothetical protein
MKSRKKAEPSKQPDRKNYAVLLNMLRRPKVMGFSKSVPRTFAAGY